jgi:hypothetical protein
MKGYRFYLEYPYKAKHVRDAKHEGNVLALLLDENNQPMVHLCAGGYCFDCVHAMFAYPNSDVCSGSCDAEYLREYGKRISEAKAREIHPALFAVLDMDHSREESY